MYAPIRRHDDESILWLYVKKCCIMGHLLISVDDISSTLVMFRRGESTLEVGIIALMIIVIALISTRIISRGIMQAIIEIKGVSESF